MRPIYNRILPPKGYKAMNLFGLIFIRKGYTFGKTDANHEGIHTRQMLELLIVFFYLFYFVEWSVKLIYYRNFYTAYRNISFEREAYLNQRNPDYMKERKHYAWIRLIRVP